MSSFTFWQKWLFVVSIIISGAGVMIAFLSGSVLGDLLNQQISPVFWGSSDVGGSAREFQQFIYGILGAMMACWGIFIAFMARYPFRNKERWAWNCLLAGMLVWFVLDTGLSAYHAVYVNVVANTAFLVLVLLPVVLTRKEFFQEKAA
jgi:hypothetical protein